MAAMRIFVPGLVYLKISFHNENEDPRTESSLYILSTIPGRATPHLPPARDRNR